MSAIIDRFTDQCEAARREREQYRRDVRRTAKLVAAFSLVCAATAVGGAIYRSTTPGGSNGTKGSGLGNVGLGDTSPGATKRAAGRTPVITARETLPARSFPTHEVP